MESLPHGLQLEIPPGCFPLTTDSMVLAAFAASSGEKSYLDLGSGCGQLGLLLCAGNERCRCYRLIVCIGFLIVITKNHNNEN